MGVFSRTFTPSSLSKPEKWLLNLAGDNTATGKSVDEESALTSTAVFASIRILAEGVGSLPLITYERQGRGKRKAINHPLYNILHNQANPEMTAMTFRETMQGHVVSWGNGYSEIESDIGGRVKALWPLRPDRVTVGRLNGKIAYQVTIPNKEPVILPFERVLHIPGFGFDGLIGYSPITLFREAIGLSLAAEEFGARFFGNGANPGGVLEHPGTLGDGPQKRLRNSWEVMHKGLKNQHRIAILEEGMTYKQIGIPPEDAQFLQTRKFQIAEIARIFNIPPHMLADLEKATFSNIEQQSLNFVINNLRAWLVRWEQALYMKLLSKKEQQKYFFEHLLEALLRGDTASRYAAHAVGRQWGWLSANDVRELENKNPLPGKQGDIYMVPLNMVPADSLQSSGTGDPAKRSLETTKTKQTRGLRSVTARRRYRTAYKKLFLNAAEKIIRKETQDVAKAAKKQLTTRDAIGFEQWLDDYYDKLKSYLSRQTHPLYRSYAEVIQVEAAKEIGAEAAMSAEMESVVEDAVASSGIKHVLSSKGQLKKVIRKAVENGDDVLEEINQRLDDWSQKRPDKIASVQSVCGDNKFAVATYALAGISKLQWVTVGKNCPYCESLSGKIVGIDKTFVNKGDDYNPDGADVPLTPSRDVIHPPLHGGCDCSIMAA